MVRLDFDQFKHSLLQEIEIEMSHNNEWQAGAELGQAKPKLGLVEGICNPRTFTPENIRPKNMCPEIIRPGEYPPQETIRPKIMRPGEYVP